MARMDKEGLHQCRNGRFEGVIFLFFLFLFNLAFRIFFIPFFLMTSIPSGFLAHSLYELARRDVFFQFCLFMNR